MRITTVPLVAASIVWSATNTPAQSHPDFSGRWTIDSSALAAPVSDSAARAARAGGADGGRPADHMGSGWGKTLVIAHDDNRLTVEYEHFVRYDLQPAIKFVFALDGSQSTNSINLGRGSQQQTSRSEWTGEKLVITTRHTFANPDDGRPMTYDVTRRLSLNSSGALTVDTVIDGVLGGPSTTTHTVYRKEQR